MTLQEIEALIASSEYDFLRDNPYCGRNIILLGLGGSHAYGTQIKDSDLDIRGITLNSKEDLLGINRNFEQFTHEETDTVIYSFNKMIKLLCEMNPSICEIMGLKPWQYLYLSPIGKEIIDHKELFISRRCIFTFGGYANQQLYKLTQKSTVAMDLDDLERHILRTLEDMQTNFSDRFNLSKDNYMKLYIDKSNQEERETEIFMDVNMTHYPLRDYLSMWNDLKNTTSQYTVLGKRNKRALDKGKIGKHMMHLVRLYHMCFEILEKHEINTYRESDIEELIAIRNGKYIIGDDKISEDFFEYVNELEKKLAYDKENTDLPEKPNYKEIEEFTISVNERAVRGDIYEAGE
jgi:hypothetical protein